MPIVKSPITTIFPEDKQGRRLLSSKLASSCLTRSQGPDQPYRKSASSTLERVYHSFGHLATRETISQRQAVIADAITGPPLPAMHCAAGMASRPPLGVDDSKLALVMKVVSPQQDVNDLAGRGAAPEKFETYAPVTWVRESLRCDGTDFRLAVWDQTSDIRKLRLHGHAQVAV